jgi:hypothetical protein
VSFCGYELTNIMPCTGDSTAGPAYHEHTVFAHICTNDSDNRSNLIIIIINS